MVPISQVGKLRSEEKATAAVHPGSYLRRVQPSGPKAKFRFRTEKAGGVGAGTTPRRGKEGPLAAEVWIRAEAHLGVSWGPRLPSWCPQLSGIRGLKERAPTQRRLGPRGPEGDRAPVFVVASTLPQRSQTGSRRRRPRPHGPHPERPQCPAAALSSARTAGPGRWGHEAAPGVRGGKPGAGGARVPAPGGAGDSGRGVSSWLRINADRTKGFVGGFLKVLRWSGKAWETDFVYCSLRQRPPARSCWSPAAPPPLGSGPPCAPLGRGPPGLRAPLREQVWSGYRSQLSPGLKRGVQAHVCLNFLH